MVERRAAFPVPWGLLIALGAYAACVTGYIAYTYWTSPEYKASVSYQRAWRILGRDEGHHCTQAELDEAYLALLDAARWMPGERELHEDLEKVAWRYDEHHWHLSGAMRLAANAQSARWAEAQRDDTPLLTMRLREQGWEPRELLAGPARAAQWSLIGAGVILIFWVYLRFSSRRVRAEEKEAYLQQVEREVEERGAQRRKPSAK
jgi:hypothetical protein